MFKLLTLNRNLLNFSISSIIVFISFFVIINHTDNDKSQFSFNINSNSNGFVQVFINNLDTPYRIQVKKNEKVNFKINNLYRDIDLLRVDPPKKIGSEVKFSNFKFTNSKKVFHIIDAQEIKKWAIHNLKFKKINDKTITLVVTGEDPYFWTGEKILVKSDYKILDYFKSNFNDNKKASLITTLVVLIMLLFLYIFKNIKTALFFCFPISIIFLIFLYVPDIYLGLDSVNSTIGRAVFFGSSIKPNQLSVFLAFTICSLFGVTFNYYMKNTSNSLENKNDDKGFLSSQMNVLIFFLFAFILLNPDLVKNITNKMNINFSNDWDSNNINTWSYMMKNGMVPVKDFWYPYAGRAIFHFDAVYSDFYLSLYKVFTFGSFVSSLYFLFKPRLIFCLLILSAIIISEDLKIFWGVSRYLPAFIIPLLYLSISFNSKSFLTLPRILFWLNVAIIMFFEPNILVYSSPAIILKLILDVFFEKKELRLIVKKSILDFLPLIVLLLIYLLTIKHLNMLDNLLSFYLSLGDHAIKSSIPTDLNGNLIKSLVLFSPFLGLSYGILFLSRKNINNNSYLAIIFISLTGIMLLQKHLSRPMDWQLFILPNLILIILFFQNSKQTTIFNYIVKGSCFGLILFLFANNNYFEKFKIKISNFPSNLYSNLRLITSDEYKDLIINSQKQILTPANFVSYRDEVNIYNKLKQELRETFFVLTDNPIFYVLANKHPPYHINVYDSSPIYEQKQNINWIKKNDPKYVIMDKNKLFFDLVPNILRIPLVYEYLVKHYEFYKSFDNFEVLKKKKIDDKVDRSYWLKILGQKVDFGFIPLASKIDTNNECKNFSENCRPVLKIKLLENNLNKNLKIKLIKDDLEYEIYIKINPEYNDYNVLLDRTLFWWLSNNDLRGVITQVDDYNINYELKYLQISRDKLY
jgi:hypothetical protein